MEKKEEKVENILTVKNLSIEFANDANTITAVDGIDFEIRKGETIGIVGESGSGKSVTSLAIMRLINQPPGKVTSGEIVFNSRQFGLVDLLQIPEPQMRKIRGDEISMIFQEPMTSLNPVYTCGDQVVETILLHEKVTQKQAKERAIELFKKVNLPRPENIFSSYPHQISGGQKQRVMIAMALACKPSILIADEPTTALDVTVQATVLELMNELRHDKDTATIFITHDLGVVAEIADRVLVMYRGNVVEKGTVWDIFANPQHPYTKGLLACRPRLDIKLKTLPVVSDFMQTDSRGNIVDLNDAKFKSVGQAIMVNYQSEEELKERQERIVQQEPILSVRNLETHFPLEKSFFGKPKSWLKAVDDISFDVYPGEILGIVGESGCGKTTLGRTILRLLDPAAGSIVFDGQDITSMNESQVRKLRKDIQIIFQDPYGSLNPRMSIGEAIMEPMRIHNVLSNDKERKEKVIDLLETVNLSGMHFNRYPHEFSGGQRQRICIARTLALQPKFIICDESVSALDVSVQAQVLNLLNQLKDKYNLTYMFISHDLSVVKFIADRVMVMNKGKIEEINFADEIYKNPKQEYTRKLIEAIPKGDLEDIRHAMMDRKVKKMEKIRRRRREQRKGGES
ncbi:MAG: peptide/nickel transport system ATP-binding protein [Flammeovirgaceae bacterium]|jgi:peptide/nickel transport system ATP-binding protein